MWFLFGFLSFVGFSIYFAIRRLKANWPATISHTDAGRYYLFIPTKGKRVFGLFIGIDAPRGLQFSLKPERWYDRFFKAIGLSAEYQVGDDHFDQRIYVVSDDSKWCDHLRANRYLRDDILGFMRLADLYEWKVREIVCLGGRLWVSYRPRKKTSDAPHRIVSGSLPMLFSMRANFAEVARDPKYRRDPFFLPAVVLLGISSGLAINGGVHLGRLSFEAFPFTLYTAPLATLALTLGGVVTGLLATAAVILLGRSARTHLVLFEIVTIGLFGAVTTSFTELRDLNIEMDTSPALRYETTILGKRTERSRRGPTRHYLTVTPWGNDQDQVKVRVPVAFYNHVDINQRLEVLEHRGFLGVRWVQELRVL